MAVKSNVFASNEERQNYYKLCRVWGTKYQIYHNLPFLNVFRLENLSDFSNWKEPHPITLNKQEINHLKTTSIDYTLCDENDNPILCIEFDGLQQGFNTGKSYHTSGPLVRNADWRKKITELKLKVALGSLFPYFVVGSEQFNDIHPNAKLTIVDAIIGDISAWKALKEKFAQGFDPQDKGFSQDEFNSLNLGVQNELIQDWVISVEVESEMENNLVIRKSAELQKELNIWRWQEEFLSDPSHKKSQNLQERIKLIENAIRYGSKITIHTCHSRKFLRRKIAVLFT